MQNALKYGSIVNFKTGNIQSHQTKVNTLGLLFNSLYSIVWPVTLL